MISQTTHILKLLLAVMLASALLGAGCTGNRDSAAGQPPGKPPAAHVANAIFENVIAESGIDFEIKQKDEPLSILKTNGEGVGLIDVDGDGLLDIVFIAHDQAKLYRNLGGFKFQDITANSGLKQEGYWSGVAVGDYDNDGKPDLYLCGYNCSALYHNEGGGRFTVVNGSGLDIRATPPDKCPEWRSIPVFFDYNGDGRLDLLVARYADFGPGTPEICSDSSKPAKYTCAPDIYTPQKMSLFRNDGSGRFAEVTPGSGLETASGRTLGVALGDYNNDGKLDVAVANDERPGDLFLNLGGGKFINKGVASGTAFSTFGKVHGGMGVDWGDYDGDGKLDLFVATYQNEAKNLYHNLGRGIFADSALDTGLSEKMDRWVTFGSKLFDYDDDGKLDLIVTNGHVVNNTDILYPGTNARQPIQLFHNAGTTFEETTGQMGEKAQLPIMGRGLAVGDLDNDGKLDVVVIDHNGKPVLLRNLVKTPNHWISVKLTGTKCNRDAIGARVTIKTGSSTQFRDCTNSGSFASANDIRLLFGLGSATDVSVTVRWPGGATQEFKGLKADQIYEVKEGNAQAVPAALKH